MELGCPIDRHLWRLSHKQLKTLYICVASWRETKKGKVPEHTSGAVSKISKETRNHSQISGKILDAGVRAVGNSYISTSKFLHFSGTNKVVESFLSSLRLVHLHLHLLSISAALLSARESHPR